MHVQQIQTHNYNINVKGILKIENFKNGTQKIVKTSPEYDKGLAAAALKNVFNGNWIDEGEKLIPTKSLMQYINVLKTTLDINLPEIAKNHEKVKLSNLGNEYSIKSVGKYQITHQRDDILLEL